MKHGAKYGVFVAVQGRAQWRVLQIGIHGNQGVEVVEGLAPGEMVVMPADSKSGTLVEGKRVTIQ